MLLFFSFLIRVISLSLSFLLSSLAASVFITFVLFLDGDPSWLVEDLFAAGGALAFTGISWFNIATWSFAPALLLLILLEFARLNSLIANLLAGGTCALAVMIIAAPGIDIGIDEAPNFDPEQLWLVALAAGFVAGGVHWLLAGHRAGRWMGTPRQDNDIFVE